LRVKIYTRSGDDGSTALGNGQRVSKAGPRVAAYGDVDELNSALGALRAESLPAPAAGELARIQDALFHVGAFLADPSGRHRVPADLLHPVWLERWIDAMEAELQPLRSFILPAGCRAATAAHLARSICRRAERGIVALHESGETAVADVLPLLNRLSDALFVCARWLNLKAGIGDVAWKGRG
jgi:cob(I)alamin adenosyltransferase